VFIEKVHIWDKGTLREILLVVYHNHMSFIFLEKDYFFMKPISTFQDINSIFKCTMANEASDSESHFSENLA